MFFERLSLLILPFDCPKMGVNKDFNVNYDQWEDHVMNELDGAICVGLQRQEN